MIRKQLGNRIKLLRKTKGYSQEHLADIIGMDRTYLASVENGKRNLSLINIQKIANGLNIDIKELFNINDTPFLNFSNCIDNNFLINIDGTIFVLNSSKIFDDETINVINNLIVMLNKDKNNKDPYSLILSIKKKIERKLKIEIIFIPIDFIINIKTSAYGTILCKTIKNYNKYFD